MCVCVFVCVWYRYVCEVWLCVCEGISVCMGKMWSSVRSGLSNISQYCFSCYLG